jgi:hypothetical protein
MVQHCENESIDDALDLLTTNGVDGLAGAVTVILNSALVAERSEYPGAAPQERSVQRSRFATGLQDKALNVPQTRDSEFYPQCLDKAYPLEG